MSDADESSLIEQNFTFGFGERNSSVLCAASEKPSFSIFSRQFARPNADSTPSRAGDGR